MKTRHIVSHLIGLMVGVAIPAGAALAQQQLQPQPLPPSGQELLQTAPQPLQGAPTPAPVSPGPASHVDPHGFLVAPGAAPLAVAPLAAAPTTACLQLHLGATVFNFRVSLNPDAYPYPITGGTITGSICGAPWVVTGGSLGSALQINGQKSPPVSGCAQKISVVGNFAPPAGYNGTYGFDGSSTQFTHHTLFLGYDKPTCP